MQKLQISDSKVLKLSNVIILDIISNDIMDMNKCVLQMENYINSKGCKAIGPLIQYNEIIIDDKEVRTVTRLLRQCNNYIIHIDEPYKIESTIRIKDCMYCRYIGPEEKMKFAYDKINLIAFEEDIALKGNSYTIFVGEQDDKIVIDVFMEREDNE